MWCLLICCLSFDISYLAWSILGVVVLHWIFEFAIEARLSLLLAPLACLVSIVLRQQWSPYHYDVAIGVHWLACLFLPVDAVGVHFNFACTVICEVMEYITIIHLRLFVCWEFFRQHRDCQLFLQLSLPAPSMSHVYMDHKNLSYQALAFFILLVPIVPATCSQLLSCRDYNNYQTVEIRF